MPSFIPLSSGFFLCSQPLRQAVVWCGHAAKWSGGGLPRSAPPRGLPPVWGRGALYSPCSSRSSPKSASLFLLLLPHPREFPLSLNCVYICCCLC